MSVTRIASIFCDARAKDGGHPKGCAYWVAESHSATEARKVAKACGWVRSDGRDLCPSCAAGSVQGDNE